ncbi:helix-turn-helix domain-containing protein [Colwellia demingiae]|uniref:Helix-turn-helix domain-containing protein n=1 Tax=Colwellia demingiae TaxID=89401 RepID=A0A5C6Q678_9GAMM|nr:AraC family transcriptional regulator [Colwellia demingiae]TWX64349.1 helix-turn-helix domain-containing protein [Colwellia demingiae]
MNGERLNWPEIYSIGNECSEKYVNSRDTDSPIEAHDIVAAGISDLAGTYDISRNSFIAHVVFFTVEGMGIVKYPGNKRVLTRGDIMIVPAGCPARYQLYGNNWKTVWFDLANVNSWGWLKNREISVHKAKYLDQIYNVMNAIYNEIHSQELESKTLADHLTSEIVIYLKRELNFEIADYSKHIRTRLEKLFQTVNHQLQLPWNVELLASTAAISPSHLYTLCREHLGINPMKKVNQLRMQRARMLLYQTSAPIADIANTVGYQNQFNFSSAFKKQSGISPSLYRKKIRSSGVL